MEIIELLKDNIPQQSKESVTSVSQFNPDTHNVMDKVKRKDKTVYKPVLNAYGNPELDDDMQPKLQASLEPVNRVPIAFQKTVVSLRKYFMNLKGSVLYCDNDQSELLAEVNRVRKSNKYSFKIEEVAERTMSELESAEMWWLSDNNEIKMRVISPEKGDLLQPVYDDYGDMIMFIRSYADKDDNTLYDVFTNEKNYTFDQNYNLLKEWDNAWNKIPIIYYSQQKPEWNDIQIIIERYETILSNLGDTNDYTGAPITVVKGNILGFANKGDQGKTINLEADASIDYLTADGSPESINLEIKTLYSLMHSLSHTPDISIETLKGQGGNSGVAFDRLFTDAQLSAESKLTSDFGESMQRSVNLVSAMVRSINKSLPDDIIEIETNAYRFDDISDFIKNSVLLKGILSAETITKMVASKYGIDEAEEWNRVSSEFGMSEEEI